MASRLERFQLYRDEDKHECNLISLRVSALLTSQSLFLTASAILYSNAIFGKKTVLISIAILALSTSALALNEIWIGCRVLSKWHELGRRLIAEDRQSHSDAELEGCYIERDRHDLSFKSVDRFSIGLAGFFCLFWIATIGWLAVAAI